MTLPITQNYKMKMLQDENQLLYRSFAHYEEWPIEHIIELGADLNWYPANYINQFSPDHYDFKWNESFTSFYPIKLRWNDDSSYARYQSDCNDQEF